MDVTRISAAWANRLRVSPDVFATTGVRVIGRPVLDSVVTATLGQGCVVLCPPALTGPLAELPPETLLDADALAAALAGTVRCSPIGTAQLWFADDSPAPGSATARVAAPADLEAIRSACDDGKWAEAGLDPMPWAWAVPAPDGTVAAAAGYANWGDLAHLGVIAAPAWRGQGFAYTAASHAVGAAIASGRLAQWRCRAGNADSARLARRLGFTRLGVQAAIDLAG